MKSNAYDMVIILVVSFAFAHRIISQTYFAKSFQLTIQIKTRLKAIHINAGNVTDDVAYISKVELK